LHEKIDCNGLTRGSLTDKLDAIAAAHFDGVEIFEPNLRSLRRERA
jgi:sugar phosphate isomerase/epimerase